MERRPIGSGSLLEPPIGCSRAVAQGERSMVSGTTDFDDRTMQTPIGLAWAAPPG